MSRHCTQCYPNADLLAMLLDKLRHHSIDTYDSEQQRNQSKTAESRGPKARLHAQPAHNLARGTQRLHWDIAVHGMHRRCDHACLERLRPQKKVNSLGIESVQLIR